MTAENAGRAYRYRFYPTDEQAQQLCQTFGCVRYVYNRALEERIRSWKEEGRQTKYFETDRMLTEWKRSAELAWLRQPSKGPLQAALRDLDDAYINFWRKQSRFPKFKSKKTSKQSATYFANCFYLRNGTLTLAKMRQPLNIVWSRPLPEAAVVTRVTVTKDKAGRWFVSIRAQVPLEPLPRSVKAVGIDLGIDTLAALSTGEKIRNPRFGKTANRRVKRLQKSHSRKQEGSSNREKARLKLARAYAKITDQRTDFIHKLTTRMIRENQAIAIEDLTVCNMVRVKTRRAAIQDSSWGELRRQLEYKALLYGREVIAIDRWYPSSKTCSACGRVVEKLPLEIRQWTCPCGATHDRDVNAAKNILAAGLAATACGDGVSPPHALREAASVCETGTLTP